jgi:signal transduction histidine kinase
MTDRPAQPAALRRITGDVRVRILASYILLLAIAAIVSVLVVRQVLLVRLDDRVEEDLAQEVEEFRKLAEGTDPETGRPFGADVRRIFEVYLERNVPGAGEQLLTIPRRGPPQWNRTEGADVDFGEDLIASWRRLEETERGEIDTIAGEARYVALPLIYEIEGDERSKGAFVVAFFTEAEREEVNEAVRIVALVALGVLVLGTGFAFAVSGRVLSPLRQLRDGVRSVTGTSLSRRIPVEGDDDLADLGRSFNAMLDRLESAFSTQRDFIRDISHELRTPIAVVRGHIELLVEGRLSEEGERQAAMALVTGELDRMSRFVDDLLLLAKAEQPDFLQLETVALDDLCDEIAANGRALAEREWVVAAGTSRSIVGDRQRLSQAMTNMIANAVSHTGDGDRIEIGAAIEEATARIWVADSGAGIPRAEQHRIFDRFARAHASRQRYEGSGLGLAIVRAVGEAHGGTVAVESEPGRGARFEIVVPVEGPDAYPSRKEAYG